MHIFVKYSYMTYFVLFFQEIIKNDSLFVLKKSLNKLTFMSHFKSLINSFPNQNAYKFLAS